MFQYEVHWWDTEKGQYGATVKEKGIVAAGSWGAAVERVRDYYGKDYVITIEIAEITDIITEDQISEVL